MLIVDSVKCQVDVCHDYFSLCSLLQVLVSPSPSLIPGSAHLDLSDFDDEVVFACLEYLYTGSSPLLQEGGRGSSPLLQEGGRGSSPLEEVLLERFALLAQRYIIFP